jgi:hypothetical protein
MTPYIRKAATWVLYPWLLTLYPIIYLYSLNHVDLRGGSVVEVGLVTLIITTIVFMLLYLLTRDPHKAGGATAVILLVFLTYGHIYNVLCTDLAHTLLAPVVITVSLIAIFLILRSETIWQRLTPYLNMIFGVLVIMSSWPVIMFYLDQAPIGATTRANPLERVFATTKVNNNPEYPDIYYIILDGYASNEFWMREYGYDNSAFTNALEERGLFVASQSRTAYATTLLSLSSSLNMRYLTDADRQAAKAENLYYSAYFRSLIANNQAAAELKQLGYSYIYIMSGYLAPSIIADTNVAFYPDSVRHLSGNAFASQDNDGSWAYKLSFWPFFLETTLLRSVVSQLDFQEEDLSYPAKSPEILWGTLEQLKEISQMEEATFTFAHIIKPHEPVQFDRDGNVINPNLRDNDSELRSYFFDELAYINTQTLELIDYLLAESSVPPIIIIQGDHGSDLGNTWSSDRRLIYFDILNAYYLPDGGTENLYDTIPPVNSFRIVLNHYFHKDYELLPTKQFLLPLANHPGDFFTYVQYMDDNRINVDLGDHIALLYNGIGSDDMPEFQVYSVVNDSETGDHLFSIPYAEIESYLTTPPEQNELVTRQGQVAFYALTTGQFQFNIGPGAQGREWAVVVDTMPAQVIYGYEVGAN